VNAIEIDWAACNGCQICFKACFVDVSRWDNGANRPVVVCPEDCVQCNPCELNCPVGAINVVVDWDRPFPSALERGREDFPERDDARWLKWVLLEDKDGKMLVSAEDVPLHHYPIQP
jgi:NAD-dependent dihydropyrimidine dehydrogenase PreA subunit